MRNEKNIVKYREGLRNAFIMYEGALGLALEGTPRGSGHADNEFDNIKASITQVKSARRVLWMEN